MPVVEVKVPSYGPEKEEYDAQNELKDWLLDSSESTYLYPVITSIMQRTMFQRGPIIMRRCRIHKTRIFSFVIGGSVLREKCICLIRGG